MQRLDETEANTVRKTRAELAAMPQTRAGDTAATDRTTWAEMLLGKQFARRLPTDTIYPKYVILQLVTEGVPSQSEGCIGPLYSIRAYNVEVTDAVPEYRTGGLCPACSSSDTMQYPHSALSDQHKCLVCQHAWATSVMANFLSREAANQDANQDTDKDTSQNAEPQAS